MKIPVPELIIAGVFCFAMISTEPGSSVAGMISTGAFTGERITGTWASYSPTRFGGTSVEFFGNGDCRFSGNTDAASSCRWQETENGRARIQVAGPGGSDVFLATVAGDYLVVRDSRRDTPYVRADSKAAHERQRLANGPSNFVIPWSIEPTQR